MKVGREIWREEKIIYLFTCDYNLFFIDLQMSGNSHSSSQFTQRAAGTREVTGCWQVRARGK